MNAFACLRMDPPEARPCSRCRAMTSCLLTAVKIQPVFSKCQQALLRAISFKAGAELKVFNTDVANNTVTGIVTSTAKVTGAIFQKK